MKQEVVNIEDVYPDENNPREKFDGIDKLAASFDLNTERPGEPFTPPILVKDGGIYRIVDGERRYRALKKRRATHFTAYVSESMDEANTMAVMLSTDDKQPLSDIEKSRGTQLMLLLGVDPVVVDKAANINTSARIKKAMAKVDDAAKDMTIDRLLAIEEFADDQEVVDKLTNCSEDTWESVLATARYQKQVQEKSQAILAIFDKFNVPVFDDTPDDGNTYAYVSWSLSSNNLDQTIREAQENGKELIAVGRGDDFFLYYKKGDEISQEEQEEEAARAERSRIKDLVAESEERRLAWFVQRLDTPEEIPHLAELAKDALVDRYKTFFTNLEENYLADLSCTPCKLALAAGMFLMTFSLTNYAGKLIKGEFNKYSDSVLDDNKAQLKAFEADGYQAEPWEEEVFNLIKNAVVINA